MAGRSCGQQASRGARHGAVRHGLARGRPCRRYAGVARLRDTQPSGPRTRRDGPADPPYARNRRSDPSGAPKDAKRGMGSDRGWNCFARCLAGGTGLSPARGWHGCWAGGAVSRACTDWPAIWSGLPAGPRTAYLARQLVLRSGFRPCRSSRSCVQRPCPRCRPPGCRRASGRARRCPGSMRTDGAHTGGAVAGAGRRLRSAPCAGADHGAL